MEGLMVRLEERSEKTWAPLQSAEWKEDMQVELSQVCEFVNCDGKGGPQEMFDEAAQHLLPLSPSTQPVQVASPLRGISATHPDGSGERHTSLLDAVLKNQEALLMVLKNQDMLKDLVDKLQKTMSTAEERIRAIEQEIGIFTQFTQELCQVGDEPNWG